MNPFNNDFYVGKHFKYLGIDMLVTRIIDAYDSDADPEVSGGRHILRTSSMLVDYVAGGYLMRHVFNEVDLPAVVAEMESSS